MPEGATSKDIHPGGDGSQAHLTNEDFRRLLMTPKPQSAADSAEKPPKREPVEQPRGSETKRAKKKSFYAKVQKEEDEREAEWSKKYRDRAKERRAGDNPDYKATEEGVPDASAYKSVAPNIDPNVMAEARKKIIQESKFLGGDMQHTHLVKGLDFVLLDKVRSEQMIREQEMEEMRLLEKRRERERARAEFTEDVKFHTTLAKNVYRTLFLTNHPEKNELFAPRRMAYVFDLQDEYAQSDIPTTLIRSRADCPTQESTTLTTNDIVINKLTQILSYLRQGSRSGRKGKKKDKAFQSGSKVGGVAPLKPNPSSNQSIFGDVGEYVMNPILPKPGTKHGNDTYFKQETDHDNAPQKSASELVKAINAKYGNQSLNPDSSMGPQPEPSYLQPPSAAAAPVDTQSQKKPTEPEGVSGMKKVAIDDHYLECYPGGLGDYGTNYDSDEDADFSKMDLGNKKGPVKRWDFDNEEDYSQYQSSREALPKAAFQYGVKMHEGRKTRRYGGGPGDKKNKEKAKLDREWQQISAILDKRKGSGGGGSAAKKQKMNN